MINIRQLRVELYLYVAVIFRVAAGPVIAVLLATNLTSFELAVYYVFGSVLAIQQIAEMGVMFNLQRKLAKSSFFEDIDKGVKKELSGEVGDYVKMTQTWYFIVSVFVIFVIGPIGYFYIKAGASANVEWQIPWICATLASGLMVLTSIYPVVLEATGSRLYVAKIKAMQGLLGSIISILIIYLDYGLYNWAASSFLIFITSVFFYLRLIAIKDFISTYSFFKKFAIDYIKENWKISLVWVTGVFYWNCLILIGFYFYSGEIAGELAFSLAVLMSISLLSITKVKANISIYANKISVGSIRSTKIKFLLDLLIYLVLFLLGSCIFYFICVTFDYLKLADKVLAESQYIFLVCYVAGSQLIGSLGNVARLFGGEPFFGFCLLTNILFPLINFLIAYGGYGLDLMLMFSAFWHFCFLGLAYYIFSKECTFAVQNKYN